MNLSPRAGKPADQFPLVNVPQLLTAYYAETPDPAVPAERVSFDTSGHCGSSLTRSFNEQHILAIAQAICRYRKEQQLNGTGGNAKAAPLARRRLDSSCLLWIPYWSPPPNLFVTSFEQFIVFLLHTL